MVKSETRRDAETGILKSKPETEKCSDLIEQHIYVTDRHKIWDSEIHWKVLRDSETWIEFAETQFSKDHSPPLLLLVNIDLSKTKY